MEDYASIEIVFLADEESINDLVKEGRLSDEYSKIANELEAWLKARLKGTPFQMRVEVE